MEQRLTTNRKIGIVLLATLLTLAFAAPGRGADPAPLELVQKIALHGPPDKRLDHMALDAKGNRLFVANMANASLDIIDLEAGRLVTEIGGQHGVQGVAYV